MANFITGNWNDMPWEPVKATLKHKVFTGLFGTANLAQFENNHPINPHKHVYEQFMMILQGECDCYVAGEKIRLTAGSWVVIPPEVEHYMHVYDSSAPVINLDIYMPKRDERFDKYDAYCKALSAEETEKMKNDFAFKNIYSY